MFIIIGAIFNDLFAYWNFYLEIRLNIEMKIFLWTLNAPKKYNVEPLLFRC